MEMKKTLNIFSKSNALMFSYLIISKVGDENRNRYNAVKNQIQAERGTTTRQLTPPQIPSAHTPIKINPKKGKSLLKPDKTEHS
jgi:hypothetical protein